MLSKNLRKLGFALALAGVITTGVVTVPSYKVQATETEKAIEISETMQRVYDNHSLGFKAIENARQLGGYCTKDARKVKPNVLLRTGKLGSSSAKDEVKVLKDQYNVTKIIDLRDSIEKRLKPDPQIPGISVVNLEIFEETQKYKDDQEAQQALFSSAATPEEGIPVVIETIEKYNIMNPDMYVEMVTSPYTQKQYAKFLQEVVNHEDGALLFHCSQGKDRTGLAAIFILAALGVDKDTIMEDFLLSNVYYQDQMNSVYQGVKDYGASPETLEATRYYAGVCPEFMERAFKVIDEQYGSMDLYLRNQLGLTESDIKTLQDKYLY